MVSEYGCYTALQCKNWTSIYSMFCLKHFLPQTHLQCWQTFVLASQYLCTPVLLNTGLFKVDLLFVKFGERFEQLYGKKPVTPNMHFHCHLKERVIDCGPVHAFWFFSFERFNGRSEIQLLPKLLAGQFVWDVKFPSEFQENLLPFCFSQESHDLSKIFVMNNATELFNSA